ncbi:helix-turn-helix domain-containing protein [Flavobacterium macacae]|uniref:Helix-turn-helix domain-containing protein n=1 Tax=Flavobacterium macacae TaxID=2488993 RepID=A0A3P3W6E9_9FLAO|nr:helix-turn-helix domain-containing protein [Flavobacterium macacae]RRJ90735.1 helix-turn-helix domain-containing protein [Flavobacterium macacae]
MIKNIPTLLLLLAVVNVVSAQKKEFTDSLTGRSLDYLFQRIEDAESGSPLQALYLKSFLQRAKSGRNWEDRIDGYKNYVHHSDERLKLTYADSMVHAAKMSHDNALIGSAYLSKGIVYYGQKKNDLALDNYLIANNYISKSKEPYLVYKVKYNIAQIKYYLGFYDEAISLFNECAKFFKGSDSRGYLNSLHCLGLCYNRVGDLGLCSQTNALGIAEGQRLKNFDMVAYFEHSEGINQYFMHNYALAIKKINGALPEIARNGDFANQTVGKFYIGKCHWALDRRDKAVGYFQQVDMVFKERNYIRPDLRENYELLIRHYKSTGKLSNQLYYIDRLIKADSVLSTSFKYLSGRIHKDYDTKELLDEKKEILEALKARRHNDNIALAVISMLFLCLVAITYWYLKRKVQYRKRFEELMRDKEEHMKLEERKLSARAPFDVNEKASALMLKHLSRFEKEKGFLDRDLTLVKLAASFGSNTKYLSKVIFQYRGIKFVDYVNELRVLYIIGLIRNERNYRNYTNEALAEEAGFSSTQRFVKAFTKKTKISPSYFLQQIRKGDADECS